MLWTAITLIVLIAGLSVVAERVRTPSPIVMLIGGILVSLIPRLPPLKLEPDFVLLVLLPPLLYSSGVGMSWRGFRANLSSILLLAIGCVVFTASAVAAVAHYLLGTSWAIGFVLGAVVSPPDAVAPMAVLRRLSVPGRLLTVLEGESLANDATALVLLSFAIAAVTTGSVSLGSAAAKFAAIIIGEVGFGVALGWLALRLRHAARDPRAELMLSMATPFVAFWPPHFLGGSGVIACVATGLFVSWNGQNFIRPATRLQGFFFWNLVIWSVEALVFLLMGIEGRTLVDEIGAREVLSLLGAGGVVALTVLVVRYVWVFPATYLPRMASPSIRARDPHPNWRQPFLVAFTGLRGVVSLAAALSVPLMAGGAPFPQRDLILVTTFVVIVVTLVGLGALLPLVVRILGLSELGRQEAAGHAEDEREVRRDGIRAVSNAVDGGGADEVASAIVEVMRKQEGQRLNLLDTTNDRSTDNLYERTTAYQVGLIEVERASIAQAFKEDRITDEA